jgi:hypothetical protein
MFEVLHRTYGPRISTDDDDVLTQYLSLTPEQQALVKRMRGYESELVQSGQLPRHARNKILLAIAKTVAPNAEKATLLQRLSEAYRREITVENKSRWPMISARQVYARRNAALRK